MRPNPRRIRRKFAVECLEPRALLTGGASGRDLVPPGMLNPSFGQGGFATSAIFGPTGDTAVGVAVQPGTGGKLVVAGTAHGTTAQSAFAVARVNANGSLDTTFGDQGTVLTEPGPGQILSANAMTVQPDGKILVAGLLQGFVSNNFVDEF